MYKAPRGVRIGARRSSLAAFEEGPLVGTELAHRPPGVASVLVASREGTAVADRRREPEPARAKVGLVAAVDTSVAVPPVGVHAATRP